MPPPSNPLILGTTVMRCRMDEVAGTAMADDLGHASMALAGGATAPIVAGLIGNARDWSALGPNDYGNGLGDATFLAALTPRFTFGAWVYWKGAAGGGHQHVVYNLNPASGSPNWVTFAVTDAGKPQIQGSSADANIALTPNVWHWVTWGIDTTIPSAGFGHVEYGIDGVSQGSATIFLTPASLSDVSCFVSRSNQFGVDGFNGLIDCIRINSGMPSWPSELQTYQLGTGALGQPTPASVSPNTAPTAGGTAVTITGQYFTGASSVRFGGVAATGVVVVDDSHITCVTPAHALGIVDVAVEVDAPDAMIGTLVGGFTYATIFDAPPPSSGAYGQFLEQFSTGVQPAEAGIATSNGLDPTFALIYGPRALAERLTRLLTTPRGSLVFYPNRCIDIRGYVNKRMTSQELQALKSLVEGELRKDEEVDQATCIITFLAPQEMLRFEVGIITALGPFSFVLNVTQVTAKLVSVSTT